MAIGKAFSLSLFVVSWLASFPLSADAGKATLYQSVDQALKHSPKLQALAHHYEALENTVKQARASYRPSIDLMTGYGLERHSDSVTRQPGADPSDTDWNTRGDVVLRLIQRLYDGGETSSEISMRMAVLDSSLYQFQSATQAVTLDAINAHLDVWLQTELVKLARQNLTYHRGIYEILAEKAEAGAGSISDVNQTRARMARARWTLTTAQAALSRAIANYKRVVGAMPGELAFAEAPPVMPDSLEEALLWGEQKNPELLAFNAQLKEADSRVALARSNYKPKINVELSSRYNDQLEGDPSWQNTNDAMVTLNWNLYRGGADQAGIKAALSGKYQSRSSRDEYLLLLREEISATWASYVSLRQQKEAFRDEAKYSRRTLEGYVKQFSVSKRSILDVLNVEYEYYIAASEMLRASKDETVTAYHILKLGGELKNRVEMKDHEPTDGLKQFSLPTVLPFVSSVDSLGGEASPLSIAPADPASHHENYSVVIGPFVNKATGEQVNDYLLGKGCEARQTVGSGMVNFIRLLVGVYPEDEALKRLKELKTIVHSAFVLQEGAQLALYAASFHDDNRARILAEILKKKHVKVSTVTADVWCQGRMLIVSPVGRQVAQGISEQMSKMRISVKVTLADGRLPEISANTTGTSGLGSVVK